MLSELSESLLIGNHYRASRESAPYLKAESRPISRVAVVHEWFENYAGSEKVVEEILKLFPQADLYGIVDFLPDSSRNFIGGRRINTTFIQKLPGVRKWFRHLLPLMPLAVESLDLSKYDLIISSSHALAKGVLTGPDQLHICYCHSPMRYAWDLQHQYLAQGNVRGSAGQVLARAILHYMRLWDYRTANGVDHFVANSRYIARRIAKVYGRRATVIYPPVDVDSFSPVSKKEDFYLAASRLVPYKRIELIAEAFAGMPDRKLIVIGDGPQMKALRAAASPNIEILGHQPFSVLRDYMQRARAFVFAAEEDFGIMPVEAQACGTPVICYGRGGVTETVIRGETGLFFGSQTAAAINSAVLEFEAQSRLFDAERIRANAECYAKARFSRAFQALVEERCHLFQLERSDHTTAEVLA